MGTTITDITIDVLGVREDGEWCAIALDMSLRGYGATFDQAVENLKDAISAQISFALQHDNLDQIFIPAEPRYHQLYADMKREALKKGLQSKGIGLPDYMVRDIRVPKARIGPFVAESAIA